MSENLSVWVVADRVRLDNPWAPEGWRVVSVQPGSPDVPVGAVLGQGPGWTRHFLGKTTLTLYRGETANYKFNLEDERPAVYVFLRRGGPLGVTLLGATVDAGEVDTHADAGDDLIEALPLPPDITAWVAAFVARHHKDEPFHKRRRDRADPEALGRRGIAGERGDG